MRRLAPLLAALLLAAASIAPMPALARAGFGHSMGSRGSFSFSAPPATRTAPYTAPLSRSITPQAPAPSYGYGGGYGGGYGYRGSPFVSGLMGGLIGAGIGGLLFGHGMFYGVHGFGGFFGLLIQVFLVVLLVRWLFRMFVARQPAMAGAGPGAGLGGLFARGLAPGGAPGPRGPATRPVTIQQSDYLAFEQLLKLLQQAWSRHDLATLRSITTPEMASYFAEQLAQQTSAGVRNTVTDVRLDQGDLSQAWAERGREYATVAMRFSMIDVTRDAAGRVVDGSPTERVTATEVWTFLRAPAARWILSAIQQTA